MRKTSYFIIIFLLLNNILITANAQNSPKVDWSKKIGGNKSQRGFSVLELYDHSLAIASTKIQSFDLRLSLVKTDLNGNTTNERIFTHACPYSARLIKSKDNNLVVNSLSFSLNENSSFLLMKTDLNFNKKFERQYLNNKDFTTNVILCSDGGYLLMGNTLNINGKNNPYIVRTNSMGDLIWKKQYKHLECVCNSAVQTQDNGFLLAGGIKDLDGNTHFWFAKVTPKGNLMWEKSITNETGKINDIIQTEDGYFLGVGDYYSSFTTNGNVIKIDESGNVIWSKRFGGTRNDEMKRIIKDSENKYLIGGSTKSKSVDDWDFWLLSIDNNGELLWETRYGDTGPQKAFDLTKTFDDGIVMVGYTSYNRLKKNIYLVKFKFSIRERATNYVQQKLQIWQTKGKFEKLDDYNQRVNENTRQQFCYKVSDEFFEQIGKPIFDKDIKVATVDYDTENEIFRINLSYFNSIYIPVPIDEAPSFDKNFKNLSFENIKYNLTKKDKLEIYKLTIHNPHNNKTYFFDGSQQINYNNKVIENNFSPIEILPTEESKQPDNQQNIDTDCNIPKTTTTNNNRYALIIGNANYIESGSDMVDIKYSINDAKIFKEYAVNILGVPNDNNHIYYIENANVTYMKRYIDNFSKLIKNKSEGEFYVYYSGHGMQNPENETFIVPVGVTSSYINNFGIKLTDFYSQLNPDENKKVIIFLDACFSGGGKSGQLLINAKAGFRTVPKKNNISANLLVFAASSEKQISQEYFEKHHGLFTYFLLKNLKQSKGKITYGELAEKIINNVTTTALNPKNGLKEQTPTINVSPKTANEWKSWSVTQ